MQSAKTLSPPRKLRRAAHKVSWIADGIAVLSAIAAAVVLLIIVFQIAGDVFSRNVFDQPFKGTVPRVEVLLVSFGALCLAPAERVSNHVAMELFVERLPAKTKKIFDLIAYGLVIALLMWMTYSTTLSAMGSYQRGEKRIGIVEVSAWPARSVIAVGLAALTVCFVDRMIQRILNITEEH